MMADDEQFDPTEHTVPKVNEHLAANADDDDEVDRVLAAEADGADRTTVVDPRDSDADADGGDADGDSDSDSDDEVSAEHQQRYNDVDEPADDDGDSDDEDEPAEFTPPWTPNNPPPKAQL